jgi:tungstate transport system permease protein
MTTNYITNGIVHAVHLLLSGDASTYSAILISLKASTCSMLLSLGCGIPLGFILGYKEFYGHKTVKLIMNTLLSLPTVVIGLVVYTFICQQGWFGNFNLLFTIKGIVIGQTILALPIIIVLTSNAIEKVDIRLQQTLLTLGANKLQLARSILYESRYALFAAAIMAYGRVISELGISMMLGGNIKWYTRTITTAIAFETGKGEFAMGIALSMVLLLIALITNLLIALCKEKLVLK